MFQKTGGLPSHFLATRAWNALWPFRTLKKPPKRVPDHFAIRGPIFFANMKFQFFSWPNSYTHSPLSFELQFASLLVYSFSLEAAISLKNNDFYRNSLGLHKNQCAFSGVLPYNGPKCYQFGSFCLFCKI